jgi:hypothetical protein
LLRARRWREWARTRPPWRARMKTPKWGVQQEGQKNRNKRRRRRKK